MKKTIIILSSVIFVFLLAFFSLYFIITAPKTRAIFLIDDYIKYIQNKNFQTQNNYGKITDCKFAATAGKQLLPIGSEMLRAVFLNGWVALSNMTLRTIHIIFEPIT